MVTRLLFSYINTYIYNIDCLALIIVKRLRKVCNALDDRRLYLFSFCIIFAHRDYKPNGIHH